MSGEKSFPPQATETQNASTASAAVMPSAAAHLPLAVDRTSKPVGAADPKHPASGEPPSRLKASPRNSQGGRRKRIGKRPEIEDFKPEGILLRSIGNRRYSDDDLDSIIAACSTRLPEGQIRIKLPRWWSNAAKNLVKMTRREALAAKLEIAAALYFRDREWAKAPTPSQLRVRFRRIKASAAALLKTLGLGTRTHSNPDLIPYAILSRLRLHAGFRGGSGDVRLREAVIAIKSIHEWTERELWMAKAHPPAKLVNKGDKSFNDFLKALGGVWQEAFGRKARISFISGNSPNKGNPCGL